MNYEEFLTYVQHGLESIMGNESQIILHKVLKNNNLELDGISIMEPQEHISPTIYLNDLYEDYQNGENPEHILQEILNIHQKYKTKLPFHIHEFKQYELVKKQLACKLVHYESNEKLLRSIPHIRFLDLAQIFYVVVQADAVGNASITIRHEHLKFWNITEHQLCQDAIHNAPLLLPEQITELNSLIQEFLSADFDPLDCSPLEADEIFQNVSSLPMYVLTNSSRLNGASALLYPGVIKAFAERMNADIYILPSSIHEVILVPDYGTVSKEALSEMVKEINIQEVPEPERLSGHVYLYQRHSQSFSM